MKVRYDMVVDFARPHKSNTFVIMKNDSNTRELHFILMANGKNFDMTGVQLATVKAVLPDESKVFLDAELVMDEDENALPEVLFTLPDSMTGQAGKTAFTITLRGGDTAEGAAIQSFESYIVVRNELYSEDDYENSDEMSGFRNILNRAIAAIKKIEEYTGSERFPNPYALFVHLYRDLVFTPLNYTGSEAKHLYLDFMPYLGKSTQVDDLRINTAGWQDTVTQTENEVIE